jgi:hypothetical protein
MAPQLSVARMVMVSVLPVKAGVTLCTTIYGQAPVLSVRFGSERLTGAKPEPEICALPLLAHLETEALTERVTC